MSDESPIVFRTPFEVSNRLPPAASPMDISDRHFIFVAGLHRSGTSLLHRALRDNPEITGFQDTGAPEDEGQHLQTVYPVAKLFGGAGRFAFHPGSRLTESSQLITDEARRRLLSEWRPYLDERMTWVVEKSPPNLIRMRFLQALIPNSTYVCIVRHPIAVAMATMKWSRSTVAELITHWVYAHNLLLQDIPSVKRIYIIRYEDFVREPNEILRTLLEHLGVQFQPIAEPVVDQNEKYFQLAVDFEQSIQCIDEVLKNDSPVSRFGYSLSAPFVSRFDGIPMAKHITHNDPYNP